MNWLISERNRIRLEFRDHLENQLVEVHYIASRICTNVAFCRLAMCRRFVLLSMMLVWLVAQPVHSAELKKETAIAFDHYIALSEKRIKSELENGAFVFIDELPPERRKESYEALRKGQVLIKQVTTKEEGQPIEIPHGLIHDWIGVLFIPNTSLAQTLAVVQDYDNHHNIYKPAVRQSKLLKRDGDNFKVFLQFYNKSVITVVINADFDIHYERFGANRALSRSYSVRLAEVENPGKADEHELPVDDAHGYVWRLYSYWRFEEKDSGVYVQLESIGLSRGVPLIFSWLVKPLLKSIPRGTLSNLLGATRAAVAKPDARVSLPLRDRSFLVRGYSGLCGSRLSDSLANRSRR